MKRIKRETTADELLPILKSEIPTMDFSTHRLIHHGWDNVVVEINNDWIFRFPVDEDSQILREIKLLERLKGVFHLQIPKIEYRGKVVEYIGFKKIQGESLTEEVYAALKSTEQEKIATDLAQFLLDMHQALTPTEARSLGYEDEDNPSYMTFIEKNLLPKCKDEIIFAFAKQAIQNALSIQVKPEEEVVLYNDLHPDNIAFDPITHRVNGVFDFGDVLIGDFNREFHLLLRSNQTLGNSLMDAYEIISGRRVDRDRVRTYMYINELCDLAEYFDRPHSDVYKDAVTRIHRWAVNQ